MADLELPVLVLPHGEGLDLPSYATPGSAGCDLRAAVSAPLTLLPGARSLVPTGIAVAIAYLSAFPLCFTACWIALTMC